MQISFGDEGHHTALPVKVAFPSSPLSSCAEGKRNKLNLTDLQPAGRRKETTLPITAPAAVHELTGNISDCTRHRTIANGGFRRLLMQLDYEHPSNDRTVAGWISPGNPVRSPKQRIMNPTNTFDDCWQSLSQISQRHGRSIVDMLVEIQDKKVPQYKSTSFLPPLECLEFIDYPHEDPPQDAISGEIIPEECGFLRRSYHNVLDLKKKERRYVALSYTWHAADGEDETSGEWWVETKERNGYKVSPVRNMVLNRITTYMRKIKTKYLWIDQHCIVQTTTCASSSSDHPDCNEKRDAVHAMDFVYQLSERPVGLLSGYIMSSTDCRVLRAVASSKGCKRTPPLAPHVSQQA